VTKDQWQSIRRELPEAGKVQWTPLLWLVDLCMLGSAWVFWINGPAVFRLAAIFPAALAIVQLYLILHEAVHGSASNDHRINDLLGHLCGWLIFLPFLPRRRNHLTHHVWAAHSVYDPENKSMIAKFSLMTERKEKTLEFLWRHWIPTMAANHFIEHWWSAFQIRRSGICSSRIKKEILFARIYIIGYSIIIGLALTFNVLYQLLCFYLPLWLLLLIMVELLNLPHHAHAPLLAIGVDRLPFWEQAAVSHDCRTLPVWSRFIILNFNLHVVHHTFPWVPWYRLPRVRELLVKHEGHLPEYVNEWRFSLNSRRRPLLKLMGHFFSRRPNNATNAVKRDPGQ
jgi:omega-6 fatty acid desaturase (delta-12 desaturase)